MDQQVAEHEARSAEMASTPDARARNGAAARSLGAPPVLPAICVQNVGKCYRVYDAPADRLKQAIFRRWKTYGRDFWAVRDVSFDIPQGQTVGIIGRNGSGKSTMLQVIAGILTPTTGSVTIRGVLSALLELGAGFNAEFTGRENVYMAGAIMGISRAKVDELFPSIEAFADIGQFIDQPVKTYSSGMFVRLAFAVAAQVRPDVLIVDEALAVGDIFFQQKCMQFIKEELASTTKLIVTHDMGAIASLCDRVLVMHKGRLEFDGPPLKAIECYTKLVHAEEFGATYAGRATGTTSDGAGSGPAQVAASALDALPWREVTDDCRGGLQEVTIERVAVTDAAGHHATSLSPGDRYTVHAIIRADQPKRNLIFGCMIVDRLGENLCGDNSLSQPGTLVDAPVAGRYLVKLEYHWPAVYPGNYTMTVGIGEGTQPLSHVVQCWAHNVVAVSAISPDRAIHGRFLNPLCGFDFRALENG